MYSVSECISLYNFFSGCSRYIYSVCMCVHTYVCIAKIYGFVSPLPSPIYNNYLVSPIYTENHISFLIFASIFKHNRQLKGRRRVHFVYHTFAYHVFFFFLIFQNFSFIFTVQRTSFSHSFR